MKKMNALGDDNDGGHFSTLPQVTSSFFFLSPSAARSFLSLQGEVSPCSIIAVLSPFGDTVNHLSANGSNTITLTGLNFMICRLWLH
jgi:hypothetical protein